MSTGEASFSRSSMTRLRDGWLQLSGLTKASFVRAPGPRRAELERRSGGGKWSSGCDRERSGEGNQADFLQLSRALPGREAHDRDEPRRCVGRCRKLLDAPAPQDQPPPARALLTRRCVSADARGCTFNPVCDGSRHRCDPWSRAPGLSAHSLV